MSAKVQVVSENFSTKKPALSPTRTHTHLRTPCSPLFNGTKQLVKRDNFLSLTRTILLRQAISHELLSRRVSQCVCMCSSVVKQRQVAKCFVFWHRFLEGRIRLFNQVSTRLLTPSLIVTWVSLKHFLPLSVKLCLGLSCVS